MTIAPELAGTVREIAFESGATVAQGDLLVRLDTSTEEAQLRSVQAQLELARINLARERTLRDQNMVSQSELDSAEATLKQNQADADAIGAIIGKKTIRAPFGGQLGIRQVNLGQYLDAGKPIVWLQTVSPVFADFSLPQQELSQLTNGMPVRLEIDAYPGRQFQGALTAVNPGLDQTTRSVSLRATLDNPNQLLRPGMFARVRSPAAGTCRCAGHSRRCRAPVSLGRFHLRDRRAKRPRQWQDRRESASAVGPFGRGTR